MPFGPNNIGKEKIPNPSQEHVYYMISVFGKKIFVIDLVLFVNLNIIAILHTRKNIAGFRIGEALHKIKP